MIRRRLSVPPERRIVRLPHTVGQVRLVGVPAVSGGCCIEDTFTEADPNAFVFLGRHKPEVGGPWECYGQALAHTGGAYTTEWPDVQQGLAGHGYSPESTSWSHARVACTRNVRALARFLISDYVEGGIKSGILLRWSGAIADLSRAAIAVEIFGYSGYVGVVLRGGTTPEQGNSTLLGLVPYIGTPMIELSVSVQGTALTWDCVNLDTGVRATKLRETDTVRSDDYYDAGTGVGFFLDGVAYWMHYCDYFRACPL